MDPIANVYGDEGNDVVLTYGYRAALGGPGVDAVFGMEGSKDQLYGDGGNDCLQDWNNIWMVYNCGGGTDVYYSYNTGTKTDCETSSVYCCGFC